MGDAVVNRSVESDGTVVVELRGELDLAINEALRLLLVETATTVRPPRIVVDMLHVSFVDSTGIGALAAGYTAARSNGVEFTVRHLAPFIAEQLRLTDLVAKLVYYAVLLFTLQLAFGIWGPNPVSDLIKGVVAWLPKAFVAILIVVIAAAVASAVRDIVGNALGGLSYGRLLANVAAWFIIGLGVIAALNQVGVA